MNVAVIAAAAAAASRAAARRREEDRRRRHRQEEERRRREQEDRRRREEERRRREQEDRRRREEERRKREIEAQKRRAHDLLQRGKNEPKMVVEPSTLAFTDRLVFDAADFPAVVSSTEFETQYADGSYSARENYAHNSYEHGYYSYVLRFHFPDGTERTYDMKRDTSYKSSKETATLLEERLPDGRIRTYDMAHHLMFERDADGNYKSYEKLNNGEIILAEEGTKDGWLKRYQHELKDGRIAKTKEIINESLKPTSSATFTNQFVMDKTEFPAIVSSTEFETQYADGSYSTRENYAHNSYEQGYYSYVLRFHFPDGTERTYDMKRDTSYKSSKETATLLEERLPDGRIRTYDMAHHLMFERDADGNYKSYEKLNNGEIVLVEEGNKDGWQKRYEHKLKGIQVAETKEMSADGKYQVFDNEHRLVEEGDQTSYRKYLPEKGASSQEKGALIEEKFIDGTLCRWNEEGLMIYEALPTGVKHEWNDNGVMIREELSNGTEKHWSNEGVLTYESLPTGELHEWNEEGIMICEKLPNHTETRWTNKSVMTYESLPTGELHKWNEEGIMTYESLPTGELHKWNAEGIMTYEKLPDRTETHWNDKGEVTYHATQGVKDTEHYLAEQEVTQKIEKVYKALKEKGIMAKDKSDTEPVTKLGRTLKSIAIKKMEKKLSK